MRRNPAPTFVFADLVGYTALTMTAYQLWQRDQRARAAQKGGAPE